MHIRKKILLYLFLFFLFFIPRFSFAAFPVGWSSNAPVEIDNTSNASALTDYQVKITVKYAASMNADFSDIRFSSTNAAPGPGDLLDHWVEEYTASSQAVFWVEIPSITASSTTTIYMYYGNAAAASTSSIDDTFLFGDEFSGGAVDGGKWTNDTGQFTVSGGSLHGGNTNYYIQSTTALSSPVIIETRTRANTIATNGQSTLGFWEATNNNTGLLEHAGGSPSRYWYRRDGSWVGPTNFDFFNWHRARISVNASNQVELYVINANDATTTKTYSNTVSNERIMLGMRYDGGLYNQTYNQDWDWIFARKYTSPEPVATVIFPISQIVFTTTPHTTFTNYPADVITIETQDETSTAQNVSADTTIDLSSTSGGGTFSLADSPFIPVTSVTIPNGQSSISFYYKDSNVGTPTVTADENPSQTWTQGQQNVTVLDLGLGIYKASVSITNSLASELTNYQVLVTLNSSALIANSHMNADGSDIRFLDSDDTSVLSYWIETPTINTVDTRIWVKIPSIPASSTKTIYLYYGNAAATSLSDETATFIFGDDFSGASVDTTKWSDDTNRFTVSGGYLNGGNTNYYIRSTSSFSDPVIIETRSKATTIANNGQSTIGFWISSSDSIGLLEHRGGTPSRYWYRNNSSWVGATNYDFFNWHKAKITIDASHQGELYVINENEETTTKTFSNTVSSEPIMLGQRYDGSLNSQNYDQDWDWIFVRKHAPTEPAVTVLFPITQMAVTTASQTLYQNFVSNVITIETQDETGAPQNVSANTTIDLSSSSGGGSFSLTDSPFSPVSSVTLASGQSSVSFYYRDPDEGTPTITAAETPDAGWTDAQQIITVKDLGLGIYKVPVLIDNTSNSSTLTNYQVLVTFDSTGLIAAGRMQPNGGDVRFLDSDDTSVLPYWIETPTINSDDTRIWVKVPTIPASSTKTIYMYYGNPAADDLGSITNTFIFGDDFSGASVDTDIWMQDTNQFTVAGGHLNGGNTSYYIKSQLTMSEPVILETRTRANSLANNGQSTIGFWISTSNCIGLLEHAGGTPSRYWYRNNSSWVGATNYDFFNWHRAKITMKGGGQGELYVINANNEETTKTFSNTVSDEPVMLGQRYDGSLNNQNYDQDWDWIFARQYVAAEPTAEPQFPVYEIVFSTEPQSVLQDRVSEVITIQTQDEVGMPRSVSENTTINLSTSSSGGAFSLASSPFSSVSSVTLPAGSDSVSFYYRDSSIGTWTMTAEEEPTQNWLPATQDIAIVPVNVYGSYKRAITIDNSSGGALTNYQLLIEFDTLNIINQGRMESDGSDIRIFDSNEIIPLYYWTETPTINTTTTRLWIRVPGIPALSTKTIYIYYGNPGISSVSNITNTFIFGDDFSGTSVDTAKWINDTSQFTVTGGYLNGGNTSYYIQSGVTFSNPIIIEDRVRANTLANNGQSTLGFWKSASDSIGLLEHAGGSPSRYWYRNNSSWIGATNYDFLNWHKSRITIDGSNQGELYVINENSQTTAKTFTNAVNSERIMLGQRYDASLTNQNYDEDWDWIFARQYTDNPPGTSLGEEESSIEKLVFSTPGHTLIQDEPSNLTTVETRDKDGNRIVVATERQIHIESTSAGGRFAPSSSPGSWSSGNSITLYIPAGEYSVSFYYKDSDVGSPFITASEYPSMGWTDATLQFVIISKVAHFDIEATTPQTAGVPFEITITAKDDEGGIAATYDGSVLLTANYITPSAGTLLLSPLSASDFIEGVSTVTCQYDDCGTITVTAVDSEDATKTGTSVDILFVPYGFLVSAGEQQTVRGLFTLNITAQNAASETTPNYTGPAGITFDHIAPASAAGSILDPDTVTAFTDGTAEVLDMTYNRWGEILIRVFHQTDASRTGETGNIMFIPKDFSVSVNDAPPSRDFFYLNEEFQAVVMARDFQGSIIPNYQGSIIFQDIEFVTNPGTYTFVEQDEGRHVFSFTCSEEQEFFIEVMDTVYNEIKGVSDSVFSKYGKIVVHSEEGPVGALDILVTIVNLEGTVISSDSSTQFKVTLKEGNANDSASSTGVEEYLTVSQGRYTITVTDSESETVLITPESLPELDIQEGSATFGSIGSNGIRIRFWREKD